MGVSLTNMAMYQITSFWYDEDTGNVFLNIYKNVDVSYDHSPEYQAQDAYEAQIYLDGGLALIGKARPASTDGTIAGGNYGRLSSAPNSETGEPLENAPE